LRSTRLSRITTLKFFDEATSKDILEGLSGVLGVRISLPFNEILNVVLVTMGIKNSLDLKVFLIVFDVQRGQRRKEAMQGNGS
jgi:hypothetical protein